FGLDESAKKLFDLRETRAGIQEDINAISAQLQRVAGEKHIVLTIDEIRNGDALKKLEEVRKVKVDTKQSTIEIDNLISTLAIVKEKQVTLKVVTEGIGAAEHLALILKGIQGLDQNKDLLKSLQDEVNNFNVEPVDQKIRDIKKNLEEAGKNFTVSVTTDE